MRAAWSGALAAVLATGRELIEAKDALAHGEFEATVEDDLPFGPRTAQRLMKVAGNEQLANPTHGSLLPPSWHTLYELSKLDGVTFDQALTDGRIRPDMERQEAAALRTGERRITRLAKAEALAAKAVSLATAVAGRRYPVVYVDPPWPHKTFSEAGKQKSPENHYPTMTPAGRSRPCRSATWPPSAPCCGCGRRSGTWPTPLGRWRRGASPTNHMSCGARPTRTAKRARGKGYWFINTHELLLLGVRGDMPAPVMGTQAESVIDAPVGRHSEKPALFRQMIEGYFPDVGRIELFARERVEGWDAWGDEAGT